MLTTQTCLTSLGRVEAATSDVTEGEPTIMPLKEANARDLSPEERKKKALATWFWFSDGGAVPFG